MKRLLTAAILAMFAGACSSGQTHGTVRALTEAQRDSVLSRTRLPGAGVVGRALSVSGDQAKRASEMNASVDSLPR